MIIFFLYGLSFFGLGLAAFLRLRQGGEIPLRKQLPWLAAFGFSVGATGWMDMFLIGDGLDASVLWVRIFLMISHPLAGLLLLKFGWGIFKDLLPLPPWAVFIPGVLIVPIAFMMTYAATTFITPSPIEIPIDIWSRYLLYLPGSLLAGIGFLRQWYHQKKLGYQEVSRLMLATGVAFIFEAFVVGLIVPAAPYGPASYYNYDRVVFNAFTGEQVGVLDAFGLDYDQVLTTTSMTIEFWRMLSAFAVTFFVIRGLDVFDAIQKLRLHALQEERDSALQMTLQTQIEARENAERWTDALVQINRQIADLEQVDTVLMSIASKARELLNSDFLGIALLEEDETSMGLKCYSTAENTQVVFSEVPVENVIIQHVVQDMRYFISMPKDATEYLQNASFFVQGEPKMLAAVYLNLDNRALGAIWAVRMKEQQFQEEDLIWLECMADQVVIAIQHGLMTAQMQSLSVTEERARIAREMHDGLAQVLGYLNLQVQTIEALHRSGKRETIQKELRHMRKAIRIAHGDVRENILSLRTTLANEKGLLPAVQEYFQEFGIQTGIRTNAQIQESLDANLSSIAEVQFVCILQEALANVRKHAEADQVELRITREPGASGEFVQMEVFDNGKGFVRGESRRSFGLQTMIERAGSVGGTLEIDSTPGKGTRLICRLPCLNREGISAQSGILSGK